MRFSARRKGALAWGALNPWGQTARSLPNWEPGAASSVGSAAVLEEGTSSSPTAAAVTCGGKRPKWVPSSWARFQTPESRVA